MAIQFGNEFEIVDIQADLPGDSTIWFQPANGLNVIYGKNGCGKSTLLKSLTGGYGGSIVFLRETNGSQATEVARQLWQGVLNRLPHGLAESTEFLQPGDSLETWSYISELTNDAEEEVEKVAFNSCRLTDRGVEALLAALDSFEAHVASTYDQIQENPDRFDFSSLDEVDKLSREIDSMLPIIRSEITVKKQVPRFAVRNPQHTLKEAHSALRDAIYKDVQLGDINRFVSDEKPVEGVTFLEGSTREIFESHFGEKHLEILSHQKAVILRNLLTSDGIPNSYRYFGWEIEDDELAGMFADFEEIVSVFVKGLMTVLSDTQIAFSPSGDLKWLPAFWVRIPDETSGSSEEEVERFFRRIRACLSEVHDGLRSVDAHAGAAYLMALENEPLQRSLGIESNRYLVVSAGAEAVDLPIRIVDLDAPLELQAIASNLLLLANQNVDIEVETSVEILDVQNPTNQSDDGASDTLILRPQDFTLRPRALIRVVEMMNAASRLLQTLDIGLSRIHLELHLDMKSVVRRRQPEFKFADSTGSNQWINFDDLSSAQQRWVKILLRILMNAWSPRRFSLLVSDEPDAGVHQGAARQTLECFASLPVPSVVASHSPMSFQVDNAHLVHLSATEGGVRRISTPILSEDVGATAKDFGVSTTDLLAFKRLLVVCEGAHDVVVIQGLLGLSHDPKVRQRTLVVAAQGVQNLLSVPAARIIIDYTNLHVLNVADNVNAGVLAKLVAGLREGDTAGFAPDRILRESGMNDLARDASPEERVMLSLLEQCVRRRLLDRFHVFGFGKRDIIEYFPASDFGLSDSWIQLRADFERFRSRKRQDFKSWLRDERGASISARKIEKAFNKLDTVDGDFAALLTEMSVLSAVGALR